MTFLSEEGQAFLYQNCIFSSEYSAKGGDESNPLDFAGFFLKGGMSSVAGNVPFLSQKYFPIFPSDGPDDFFSKVSEDVSSSFSRAVFFRRLFESGKRGLDHPLVDGVGNPEITGFSKTRPRDGQDLF